MEDNSIPYLFLASFIVFICFGMWFVIDGYLIRRFEGKIKRGVKIWSKELSHDSWQYLLNLRNDVVEYRKMLLSEQKTAFIRVQAGEAVIFSMPQKFHSSWPYVGYVDLTSAGPELEYRASLPGIIFLIPFTIFGLIIFAINFIFLTRAIDAFLERKTKENLSIKRDTVQ